jgi:hypothetical protein
MGLRSARSRSAVVGYADLIGITLVFKLGHYRNFRVLCLFLRVS